MPATLKLTGGTTADLDLSSYLNAVEGEGLDPAPGGNLEPQFNDGSIGDGQGLVNINVQNSESVWPLHLRAASKDALHVLVQTLRKKLDEPDVMVLWQDQGATNPTYRDLEFGRWEPGYRYHRARQFMLSGSLRCWALPYGHTATDRIVASSVGTTPFLRLSIGSVAGDVDGVARHMVSTPSAAYHWAVISRLPSSNVLGAYPAASIIRNGVATLVGNALAAASQYAAFAVATSETGQLGRITVPSEDVKGLAHRVFAVVQSKHQQGAALHARSDHAEGILGPTVLLSPSSIATVGWWQLADLGVLYVPSAMPSRALSVIVSGGGLASGAITAQPALGLLGTHPMALNWLAVLPEETTSVVAVRGEPNATQGAAATYTFQETAANGVRIDAGGTPARFTDLSAGVRGAAPNLTPGANTLLVALVPRTEAESDSLWRGSAQPNANWAFSVQTRVRERFSFQR